MFEFSEKVILQKRENDILTVGELLIDMISAEYPGDSDCNSYSKYFGGSPSNIAMNGQRLGINTLVASAIGRDSMGEYLKRQLDQEGMDISCIQQVDYSTSMVVVTKSTGSPVPIFYRNADYHLDCTPELEGALKNSSILHFSCWPISYQPSRGTILKLFDTAREQGLLIAFDPNYHPMIWQPGEDGRQYVKSILQRVDIVKPSEDDAERLFGKDTPENQIEKYLKLGAALVIMTLGKNGLIASNGRETVKLQTLAQVVVDTTGAGDAFWSGFYAAIIKRYTLREALSLGSAVSAYKLGHVGAVAKLPRLEEIKKLYCL